MVPGVALRPGLAQAQLVRLVGRPDALRRTRGSSSSTRETSNWTWDEQSPAPTTGTASSTTSPTSTTTSPRCRRRCSTSLRFWLDLGLDGCRLDAVPYLFEREGTNCENLPETHAFLRARARDGRRRVPRPRAARRGQPMAGGRRRVLRRRRRVPHGVPLPGDAADVHGAAPRAGDADLRDPRADARDPRQLPVGPVPAQPRRADARDGHRRGARLHVRRVREGPADEDQRRHPPPARAAARQQPRRDRAADRDHVLAARVSPVLYYGDEIAMGDNVFLGDRDGVRTPMQWTRRPQRRLQPRRLRPALRAAADGPRLRLPGGQRRGAAAHADLAAALAAALHRAAQGASGVRARQLRAAAPDQPEDLRARAPLRGRHRAVRPQPRPLRPGGRARPLGPTRAATRRRCSAAPGSRGSASSPTC